MWYLVPFLSAVFFFCQADVFVSNESHEYQNCGSFETPCGSIQAGINTACNNLESTVWIEPGTYNETIEIENCSLSIK